MNKIVSHSKIKSTLQSKLSLKLSKKSQSCLTQQEIDLILCTLPAPEQATYRQLIVMCGKKGYSTHSHAEWDDRFGYKDRSTRSRHMAALERAGLVKSIQLGKHMAGSRVIRTTANTYKSALANLPKYQSNKTPYSTLAHIRYAFEGGSEEQWVEFYYDEYKRLAEKAGKGKKFNPDGRQRTIHIMNKKSRERIAQSHAEKKWNCDPKCTLPLEGAKNTFPLKYSSNTSYYSSSKKEPPSRTHARRPDKIIDFDGGFSFNLKNSSIKVCDYQRAEQVARLHPSKLKKADDPCGYLWWLMNNPAGIEKTKKLEETIANQELQKQKAQELRKKLDEFATPLLGRHEKEGYTVTKTDQGYSFYFNKTKRVGGSTIGFESQNIEGEINTMKEKINESIHNTRTADPVEESPKSTEPILRQPDPGKEGPSMGDGKPRTHYLGRARSPRDKFRALRAKKPVEKEDRAAEPDPSLEETGPGQSSEIYTGCTEQPCVERRQPSILDSGYQEILERAENSNKDSIRMSASLHDSWG